MSLTVISKRPRTGAAQQSGIGLIEILVALLILAIGVLGLTALQSTGLQNNRTAYMRTQATVLAYDIIDRMRANSAQANTGSYIVALGAASGTACTASCTPAQIATTDLIDWKGDLALQLPQGDGVITALAGTTNGYTVQVQWANLQDPAQPHTLSIGVQL